MTAATVAGLVGLVSVAGKPAWGFLMDRMLREQVFSMASLCLAAGVGLLVLSGSRPTSLLPYGYALVLGLGYAVTAPIAPAVSSDLFKGPGFSVIFGCLHMALCVARGQPFLGRATRKRKVMYVFLEDGRRRVAWRFKQLGLSPTDDIVFLVLGVQPVAVV